MTNSNALVQKLWNYCNILRDNGLSYCDYVGTSNILFHCQVSTAYAAPLELGILRTCFYKYGTPTEFGRAEVS